MKCLQPWKRSNANLKGMPIMNHCIRQVRLAKQIFEMAQNKKPFLAVGSLASNLGIPANELLN